MFKSGWHKKLDRVKMKVAYANLFYNHIEIVDDSKQHYYCDKFANAPSLFCICIC